MDKKIEIWKIKMPMKSELPKRLDARICEDIEIWKQ